MQRRRNLWLICFLGTVVFMLGRGPSQAQDSNYWTDQIGNRSQLLGGAVIGSDENLSAVFYNPGRIGRGVDPELIISGDVFEFEQLKVIEDEQDGKELTDTSFRGVPSLFAGEIYGKWLGENRLAYSFFTRYNAGFRSTDRFGDTFAPEAGGPFDFFEDEVRIDSSLSEHWAGLTWARAIGTRQGIGVSTFVAVRSQRAFLQNIRQAIFDNGDQGISVESQDMSFNYWRLLWKAGYSTELVGWRLGVSLTTPSLGLFGSGEIALDDSIVVTDPAFPSVVNSNFQDDIDTSYKSPVSVGFGASRDFSTWSLNFSMEWFDSVSPYTVLDADPIIFQPDGEIVDPAITQALDSVTNFAVGYEKRFANETRFFGSLRSDFSAATDSDEDNLSVTKWDLWHLGGGVSFRVGKSDLTAGLIYAFGDSEPTPLLTGSSDPIQIGIKRLTLLIGFELPTNPHNQGGDNDPDS